MPSGKRQGCFQLKKKEKDINSTTDEQKKSRRLPSPVSHDPGVNHVSSSLEDISSVPFVCWPVIIKRKQKALREIGNVELKVIGNGIKDKDARNQVKKSVEDPFLKDEAELDLAEPSAILNEYMKQQLSEVIPKAWLVGHHWTLSYSTINHGYSLNSLYRRLRGLDAPTLLVIRDGFKQVFGAMLPCSICKSNQFYGNGQSFLFTFYDEFKTYEGSGDNWLFVKGNLDSIAIGASDGSNGLWLEASLFRGRTQECSTFNNPILTEKEDFLIEDIEVWTYNS